MIIVYEMQYIGNIVESDIKLIPFDDKFYDAYESIYNECFYHIATELVSKLPISVRGLTLV